MHQAEQEPGLIAFSTLSWPGGKYSKDTTASGVIQSVRTDGTGLRKLIDRGALASAYPQFSPDGKWLYFQGDSGRGSYHVYRCRPDGSGVTDITADEKLGKDSFGYLLSTDGRMIVFTSSDGKTSRVATMKADGSQPRLLAGELGYCYMASFSPDARRVVFAHTAEGYRLKAADLDGKNMVTLTPDMQECFAPQFTGDGRWIIFIRRDGDIYRVAPDGTNLKRLTQGNNYIELHLTAEDEHGSTDAPDISPEGRKLAFCAMKEGLSQVHVMNIDGADMRQLTHLPNRCGRVKFSPDGRQIAFVSFVRESQPQLFFIDADGGRQKQLTDLPAAVYFLDWRP